ncbi:MAG: DUF2878 domain-containing protein [Gammaproteobacteria bacterium]|nr:DUF2878 domain-containing protein [Gammaproteobacteria bacterium]
MNSSLINNLINLVFFQGVWFITVIGAAEGNTWYGIAGLSCFVCIHYLIAHTVKADLLLAAVAIFLGLIIETAVIQTGVLKYVHSITSTQFAPLWILILWANLALTLNGCLRWLQGRYMLAAILGAAGGPLTYFAGIKLGAATTTMAVATALGVIAVIYAIVTPLLLLIAKQVTQALK